MSLKIRRVLDSFIALVVLVVTLSGSPTLSRVNAQESLPESQPFHSLPLSVPYLGIAHGAHLRPVAGNGAYGQEVAAFNDLVGKDLAVLMFFAPWSAFDSYLPDQIQSGLPASKLPVLMLTWEPSVYSTGCDLGYNNALGPLTSIVMGRCDNYIRDYARALKARPERYLLRMAHEMNITDSSWWPGHYGQSAESYVAMWRHVHQIFASEGVTNVEWVWSPNYASNPVDQWNDLHNYYPGDAYVDWIGLSGYNWYNQGRPEQSWKTFAELFDAVLTDLACRYAKPQMLIEFGSVDGTTTPQTKENWITEAYAALPTYPFVRAVVLFNDYAYASPQYADFRVTTGTRQDGYVGQLPVSTGAWTSAYRNAVANSTYRTTLPSLSEATPAFPYCPGEAMFRLSPELVMLQFGDSSQHSVFALFPGSTYQISLIIPEGLGIVGEINPSVLSTTNNSVVISLATSDLTPVGTHQVLVDIGGEARLPIYLSVHSSVSRVYLPLVSRH